MPTMAPVLSLVEEALDDVRLVVLVEELWVVLTKMDLEVDGELDGELDGVLVEPDWMFVTPVADVDCDASVFDATVPVVGCVGAAAPATWLA